MAPIQGRYGHTRCALSISWSQSPRRVQGPGDILSAEDLEAHYGNKGQEYLDRVGAALNIRVNELAEVLHRFWLNEVR